MRSDQTAQLVAARPYASSRERERALYEHARRVVRARREDPQGALAREPMLTHSGSVIFAQPGAECLIGTHGAAVVYAADSTTHRVLNRNGEECATWLCTRHWSEYKREDGDAPDLPVAEVRYSRALEAC
jgi:hypothetical protein